MVKRTAEVQLTDRNYESEGIFGEDGLDGVGEMRKAPDAVIKKRRILKVFKRPTGKAPGKADAGSVPVFAFPKAAGSTTARLTSDAKPATVDIETKPAVLGTEGPKEEENNDQTKKEIEEVPEPEPSSAAVDASEEKVEQKAADAEKKEEKPAEKLFGTSSSNIFGSTAKFSFAPAGSTGFSFKTASVPEAPKTAAASPFSFGPVASLGSGGVFGVNVPKPTTSSEASASLQVPRDVAKSDKIATLSMKAEPTGEEEEETKVRCRGKLYLLSGNAWSEKATGTLKLNVNKKTRAARIVMRTDGSLRVVFNAALHSKTPISKQGPRFVRLGAVHASDEGAVDGTWLLKLASQDAAEQLVQAGNEFKANTDATIEEAKAKPQGDDKVEEKENPLYKGKPADDTAATEGKDEPPDYEDEEPEEADAGGDEEL